MFQLSDCKVVNFFVTSVGNLSQALLVLETDHGRRFCVVTSGKGVFDREDYEYLMRILGDSDNSWDEVVDVFTTSFKNCQGYFVKESSAND